VRIDQSIASGPSLRRLLWLRYSFASLAFLADPDVDETRKKLMPVVVRLIYTSVKGNENTYL
jgi:hypothetical protein